MNTYFFFSETKVFFHVLEPFVVGAPLAIMLPYYFEKLKGSEVFILCLSTMVCTLLVAGFGLTKYLKHGPCQLIATNGSFSIAMLFNMGALLGKGVFIASTIEEKILHPAAAVFIALLPDLVIVSLLLELPKS